MKRRAFLTSAAVGAAAGATHLAAPAVAKRVFEWKMVMPWPRNAPGVGVNAERLAKRITEMSGGRLQIRLFAGGELVPPFESFEAVRTGTADLLHGTPYYWVSKADLFQYFTAIPFGMTATEFSAWLYYGGGQALWDEAYADFGLKPFYAGNSGVQAGGWFRREIDTMADFAGLKIRIAGLGGEVLRRAAAVVVLLPPGDIVPAMQSGAIDAAEWVGPWNDLAFGLPKVAPYYYLPAFHEPGAALELSVNKEKYDALPADLRAIVSAAASSLANETLADFTFHNTQSLPAVLDVHDVKLRQFPDEVVESLGALTREVLEELWKDSGLAARVHRSYMAFLKFSRDYSGHFDETMLRHRRLAWGE